MWVLFSTLWYREPVYISDILQRIVRNILHVFKFSARHGLQWGSVSFVHVSLLVIDNDWLSQYLALFIIISSRTYSERVELNSYIIVCVITRLMNDIHAMFVAERPYCVWPTFCFRCYKWLSMYLMCLFMLNTSVLFYMCACVLLLSTDIYLPFKNANCISLVSRGKLHANSKWPTQQSISEQALVVG